MSKTVWNRYFFGLALITSLALLAWIAGVNAGAQTHESGNWTASVLKRQFSNINLNFERRTDKGRRHQTGQTYEFSDLQGLSREQAMSGGPVSFSLVREAGRIDCEGSFQNGKGSGTFRFTPNAAFVSAMKSRGFDFEQDSDNDERLSKIVCLRRPHSNVTTALADDLASAGFR